LRIIFFLLRLGRSGGDQCERLGQQVLPVVFFLVFFGGGDDGLAGGMTLRLLGRDEYPVFFGARLLSSPVV
jgi:hypothetical protein